MPGPKNIESHLTSVGELLRHDVTFKVPYYQRDFAWTTEEVETLWADLHNAFVQNRVDYFLGAMVISGGTNEKTRDIVDGQQRLAVLSMIFSAIAGAWMDRSDPERSNGVFFSYLGEKDRESLEIVPKLVLNSTNETTFKSIVLDRKSFKSPKERDRDSNSLIKRAYSQVTVLLGRAASESRDSKAFILAVEKFIRERVKLIMIEVADDADAFMIFETLNDRGLDLAVSDLVKNYLFARADTSIELFKKTWNEVVSVVGGENLTEFLRHHWLSTRELVRERDLYRALKDKVKTPASARSFMNEIRQAADLYAALSQPQHTYWSEYSEDTESDLRALIRFKVTQYKPVALAAMQMFLAKDVSKVLSTLMIISYRYTVVSALGTGNLEKIYSDCALAIRSKEAKSPRQVFAYLKDAYVDDRAFVDAFAAKAFAKPEIARYTLRELNSSFSESPEFDVSTKLTLEHVLPKNPGKEWKGAYDPDELPYVLHRIGNLTLVEKVPNRLSGNADFDTKKAKLYRASSMAINQQLSRIKSWNVAEIEKRSKKLASQAQDIWTVEYA